MIETPDLKERNTPEKKFYATIFSWLHFRGHLQRIETSTTSGVPDVNFCTSGIEVWMELKVCKDIEDLCIRKEQYAWCLRRSMAKGHVFIVALITGTGNTVFWEFPQTLIKKRTGKYLEPLNGPSDIMFAGDGGDTFYRIITQSSVQRQSRKII